MLERLDRLKFLTTLGDTISSQRPWSSGCYNLPAPSSVMFPEPRVWGCSVDVAIGIGRLWASRHQASWPSYREPFNCAWSCRQLSIKLHFIIRAKDVASSFVSPLHVPSHTAMLPTPCHALAGASCMFTAMSLLSECELSQICNSSRLHWPKTVPGIQCIDT